MDAKILDAIEALAKEADIIALVREIEAKLPTTKDHYGDYMSILGQWGNSSKIMLYIVSEALKKAGANVSGVNWAVKILNG